ncbi:MAG: MgtC/SapB family protein [Thermoplasmata archaeon]
MVKTMVAEIVNVEFLVHSLIAVGLGGLIGLEREHRIEERKVIAGVRTFPLTALSGVIFSFLAGGENLGLLLMGLLIFGGFALIMTFLKFGLLKIGVTTPVAFFITFLIGIMVQREFLLEAAFITVLVTALLLTKERLHHLANSF